MARSPDTVSPFRMKCDGDGKAYMNSSCVLSNGGDQIGEASQTCHFHFEERSLSGGATLGGNNKFGKDHKDESTDSRMDPMLLSCIVLFVLWLRCIMQHVGRNEKFQVSRSSLGRRPPIMLEIGEDDLDRDDEEDFSVEPRWMHLLSENVSLRHLPLSEHQMGDVHVIQMAHALRDVSNLCHLDLSFNRIGCVGAAAVASALFRHAHHLCKLELQGNRIGNDGAAALSEKLLQRPATSTLLLLQVLNLGRNEIGNEGAGAIADGLKTNQTLETLFLNHNRMDDIGAGMIAESLELNTTLLELVLSKGPISHVGLSRIASALRHKTGPKISIQDNTPSSWEGNACAVQFMPIGASRAFSRLRTTRVKTVQFQYCHLRDSDMVPISTALQKNTAACLQSLCLSGNEIGDHGAVALGHGLVQHCACLQILDVSQNKMGNSGICALADALVQNSLLCELYLCCNNFDDVGAIHVANALSCNKPALSKLDLYGNAIGDEGAIFIANVLLRQSSLSVQNTKDHNFTLSSASTPSLEFLHLGDNKIGNDGAVEIAAVLEHHNSSLKELYLRPNDRIGHDGIGAIYNVLLVKPTTVEVDIIFPEE